MTRWAARLAGIGSVERFDYTYRLEGRRAPDRLPKLIAAHRAALAAARGRSRRPIVAIGKSMGSRVGCHLSVEDGGIDAVICLGYPLVGRRGAVRDQVLYDLRAPALFVQGTADPLGPPDRFAPVLAAMAAPSALYAVDGADHSLALGVRALARRGLTQDDVDDGIIDQIRLFLAAFLP